MGHHPLNLGNLSTGQSGQMMSDIQVDGIHNEEAEAVDQLIHIFDGSGCAVLQRKHGGIHITLCHLSCSAIKGADINHICIRVDELCGLG